MVPVSTRLLDQIFHNRGHRTLDAVRYIRRSWPYFDRKQGARPSPQPKARVRALSEPQSEP
eukprot:8627394-Pyramimonas_sp.AAC.1